MSANPARLRVLTMRIGYAVESVAQFNHCTSRKYRRAFARYLLQELRSIHAELTELHKQAYDDDERDEDGGRPVVEIKHSPRCGIEFRGCAPDCTFERDWQRANR